jgi:hypothetical protein
MRITQLYSLFTTGFKEGAMKKFNLVPYEDVYSPVLIIGAYSHRELSVILNNQSFAVVYWGGTDAQILRRHGRDNFWTNQFRKKKNIKHISTSHWISEDLEALGLDYKFLPVSLYENAIKPYPLGDSIYMYNPESTTYNGGMYEDIKKRLPEFTFIERTCKTGTREDVMEVYKKCFIGLRFTEHDGMSETAVEMGLMGRRMIHNGDLPNCIKYEKGDIEGIVDNIRIEYQNRKYGDDWVCYEACKVSDFLHEDDDWLNTEFYE